MGSYICSCFERYRNESYQLGSLALPSVAINSLEMLMLVVDTIMLGQLGKGNLAAATIGWSYINIIWMFIEGVLTAQDTLSAHSVGTSDYQLIRYWLIVSALVASVLTAIGSILLIASYPIIGYLFQTNPHTAIKASIHIFLMIPGFWALAAFRVIQKYFQSQGIMAPIITSMVAGNVVNFLGDYILMFATGIGFAGCGISTSIARISMFFLLFRSMRKTEDYEELCKEAGTIISLFRSAWRDLQQGRAYQSLATAADDNDDGADAGKKHRRNSKDKAKEKDRKKKAAGKPKPTRIITATRGGAAGAAVDEEEGVELGLLHTTGAAAEEEDDDDENELPPEDDNSNSDSEHGERKRDDHDRSHDHHQRRGASQRSSGAEELVDIQLHDQEHGTSSIPAASNTNSSSSGSMQQEDDRHRAARGRSKGDATSRTKRSSGGISRSRLNPNTQDSDYLGAYHIDPALKQLISRAIRFLVLGVPGGLMLGLDSWCFDAATFLIVFMGSVALNAQQILVTITMFAYFSVPFAISTASTIRIGSLQGAQMPAKASAAAIVTVLIGALVMGGCGTAVYFASDKLGRVFTSDDDVVQRMIPLAPLVSGFQVAYGVQGCMQGVLRGIGRQGEIAMLTFLAVWVVGLPTGYYLAYETRPRFNLVGMWAGFTTGMGLLAVVLLIQLFTINWDLEMRKALLKTEAIETGDYLPFATHMPGGRAAGGIDYVSNRLLAELEDAEHMNIFSVAENQSSSVTDGSSSSSRGRGGMVEMGAMVRNSLNTDYRVVADEERADEAII